MPEIILRPALASDAPAIRDLIHRVGINPLDLDWRHFSIAASADSRFMGCGQLKPHRDGSLELASLAVETGYRGQGVARAIVEHLLANSPRPLYLMCQPVLTPLYEKFGFRTIGPEADAPLFSADSQAGADPGRSYQTCSPIHHAPGLTLQVK